jgi:hypothetical protein
VSQEEVVQLAKAGKPQAIAALISKSLEPKGMTARVTSNNGCLVVQVEAQTAPEQQSIVNFVKSGILNLKPESITRVIVRGRVTGQTTAAWQESFNLAIPEPEVAISPTRVEVSSSPVAIQQVSNSYVPVKASTSESALGKRLSFIKSRTSERLALVVGTAVLTSACWLGVGALGTQANRPASVASTASPEATASTAPQDPGVYLVKGKLQLVDSDIGGTASDCYGNGGYDDIEAGMPVTIRDGQGTILATGQVGTGTQPSDSQYSSVMCVFDFQVDNVPKADFYAIEVGRRGQLNYSFAEMKEKDWTVSLSLGT